MKPTHTNEEKVPAYTLPPLLTRTNGDAVQTAEAWQARRREILNVYAEHIFGHAPPPLTVQAREHSATDVFGGTALRREIDLTLTHHHQSLTMRLLIYTPTASEKTSVPLFLGLNFHGNHTVESAPSIALCESWVRNDEKLQVIENQATEFGRGGAQGRWCVREVCARGYGIATIYYGDIAPDDGDDGFHHGVHALFAHAEDPVADNAWGAIAAWSWGLSRALDYLETDARVDAKRVAVIGHSRLGKTALWAGACDERFALVISNNSGCGGAALSRRAYGETIAAINSAFPHWFCRHHRQYNDNEGSLPVDQHMLIALAAPRPVYVASATEDQWADPKGEFLAALHAGSVYELFAHAGLSQADMPTPDTPLSAGRIGYHLRAGGHDLTGWDWAQYLRFADTHL